jgi:hypothetical protein
MNHSRAVLRVLTLEPVGFCLEGVQIFSAQNQRIVPPSFVILSTADRPGQNQTYTWIERPGKKPSESIICDLGEDLLA